MIYSNKEFYIFFISRLVNSKNKGVGAQFSAQKLNFMKPKAIIVSGYFNPIYKGHIEYFNSAKACGDRLVVIVNSDYQRALKGSKEFLKEDERVFIVSNINSVDEVVLSIDYDRAQCETIKSIYDKLSDSYQLTFANGGNQNHTSIPEAPICLELGIELIEGLEDKIQYSNWSLE